MLWYEKDILTSSTSVTCNYKTKANSGVYFGTVPDLLQAQEENVRVNKASICHIYLFYE